MKLSDVGIQTGGKDISVDVLEIILEESVYIEELKVVHTNVGNFIELGAWVYRYDDMFIFENAVLYLGKGLVPIIRKR